MTDSDIGPGPQEIDEDFGTALAVMDDYERRLNLRLELEKWYVRKFNLLFWLVIAAMAVKIAFNYFGS